MHTKTKVHNFLVWSNYIRARCKSRDIWWYMRCIQVPGHVVTWWCVWYSIPGVRYIIPGNALDVKNLT